MKSIAIILNQTLKQISAIIPHIATEEHDAVALFEVALDEQLEHHLKAAAQSQRADQSEIVRQALADYFRSA